MEDWEESPGGRGQGGGCNCKSKEIIIIIIIEIDGWLTVGVRGEKGLLDLWTIKFSRYFPDWEPLFVLLMLFIFRPERQWSWWLSSWASCLCYDKSDWWCVTIKGITGTQCVAGQWSCDGVWWSRAREKKREKSCDTLIKYLISGYRNMILMFLIKCCVPRSRL